MTSGTNKVAFWPGLCRHKLPQTVHTGMTPFPCILGFQPLLLPWTGKPSEGTSHGPLVSSDQEGWDLHMFIFIEHYGNIRGRLIPGEPHLPATNQIEGLTLNLRYPAMAPFKEVKSSFHQPIPHYSPNKSCYLQTTTSKSL